MSVRIGLLVFVVVSVAITAEGRKTERKPSKWTWKKFLNGLTPDAVCLKRSDFIFEEVINKGSYNITKLITSGATVHGINLSTLKDQNLIESLRQDLLENGFLLFKKQGLISATRQMEISQWFGLVPPEESWLGYYAATSYLSNDEQHGETMVGVSGWHTDGYCAQYPYAQVILHPLNVSLKGDTLITSIPKALQDMPPRFRQFLSRINYYIVDGYAKGNTNPLLVKHHITGRQTLQFYFGTKCRRDVMIETKKGVLPLPEEETKKLSSFFEDTFQNPHIMHRLHWEAGDFLVMDNWGVGHLATMDTQLPTSLIGLRRLQRSTTFPAANIETFKWRNN
eukprot:TRINITY_DN6958_c0_g1_i3.p1 TRINITY_DN6958_c0_g1~~TRINITY_DN6958_c0_g1_i3.p1  ORF type:complete len:355 (-),score=91.64 TRINITY_DN6958_c0_g1_i3:20-1033(-)